MTACTAATWRGAPGVCTSPTARPQCPWGRTTCHTCPTRPRPCTTPPPTTCRRCPTMSWRRNPTCTRETKTRYTGESVMGKDSDHGLTCHSQFFMNLLLQSFCSHHFWWWFLQKLYQDIHKSFHKFFDYPDLINQKLNQSLVTWNWRNHLNILVFYHLSIN